jgi:hypothetical protein
MRWQDCEAHVWWGDNEVMVTLRHLPTKIGLVKRYVPNEASINWSEIFGLLDKDIIQHFRSK